MGSESKEDKEGVSRAEVPKIQPLRKPFSVTAISVSGIFILAIFYTFYFAREFFLPVTLALILSFLLKPAVRALERAQIPSALGSGVVLLALLSIVIAGVFLLSAPASNWIQRAPETLERIEQRVRGAMNSSDKITKAAETVEQLTGTKDETPKVEVKEPGLINSVWNQTKGL